MQEDMVGLLPIDDRHEPLGRRILSQSVATWMVMTNSKPERSMATGLRDDGGD
jgi:hypothetical protein